METYKAKMYRKKKELHIKTQKMLRDFPNKKHERKQQQFYIKKYTDELYKIVAMQSVREKYVSCETLEQESARKECEFWKEVEKIFLEPDTPQEISEERMEESISRTKRIIYEYAICNDWDYFVTLTLDGEKVDRYNLKSTMKKFSEMMVKINAGVTGEEWGRQKKVEYVIIPELHKDGAVHFHGFMRGFHKSDIRVNEYNHIEWKQWRENFGFCNLSKIRNKNACSAYVTKYVTKDLKATIKEKGAHMFYASHGLKKAETIYSGGGQYFGEYDYVQQDGYCAVATVTRQQIHDNFIGEWGQCIE